MAIYTLRSFASSGRIVSVQRLSAEDDEEALSMARTLVKGASAVARFEVWQGERRIEAEPPTSKQQKKPAVKSGRALPVAARDRATNNGPFAGICRTRASRGIPASPSRRCSGYRGRPSGGEWGSVVGASVTRVTSVTKGSPR